MPTVNQINVEVIRRRLRRASAMASGAGRHPSWNRRSELGVAGAEGGLPVVQIPDPGSLDLLLARDPVVDPRHRRFQDTISQVFNSLVRQGVLIRVGREWQLIGGAGGVISFNGRTGEVTFRDTDLPNSGVVPGEYTFAEITVDQYGRVVLAAAGGPLQGVGPPAAALGVEGGVYFDVTIPDNIQFYYKA